MIIEEDVFCNNYEEKIYSRYRGGEVSRGMYVCANPDCRCGKFYRHASYDRWIIPAVLLADAGVFSFPEWLDASMAGAFRIRVLRVICTGCGRTDTILPADAIPYHAFSVILVLKLVLELLKDVPENKKPVLHQRPGLSWPLLRSVVFMFCQYEERMMAALRLSSLYEDAEPLPACRLLATYAEGHPPSAACLAFLHCFRAPLFVTRHSTVSSPMRFILKPDV